MKKGKFSIKRKEFIPVVIAFAIGIVIGITGNIVEAAESSTYAVNSYGVFTYDDGDKSNNNGHAHDLVIDTSDIKNLANIIGKVEQATDELNNNLNDVKFITEGSGADTKYYVQMGADAASKKLLGGDYDPLQVYWESSSSQYLCIPTNGHDIKITFYANSTDRDLLWFYGADKINDISNATKLDVSDIEASITATFSVKQYKYMICRSGTGVKNTFNTLIEWV